MAVPKKKTSKAKTRGRKAINMKMKPLGLTECGTCGNKILSHKVCPKCGFYKGKQYLKLEEIA